jgi:hypothetical protein
MYGEIAQIRRFFSGGVSGMDNTIGVDSLLITTVVTVVLALVGYLITHQSNIRLSQRAERLNRVNRQLSELYGPLYTLAIGGGKAYDVFDARYFKGRDFYDPTQTFTEEELKLWRTWITTVFMPRNLHMYELIVTKGDLLLEPYMDESLLELTAHVASYQALLQRWEEGDFTDRSALIKYPGTKLNDYCQRSFIELKKRQSLLLGSR